MRVGFEKCLGTQLAFLILLPMLAFAQSLDQAQNLEACENGRETCNRALLSNRSRQKLLSAFTRTIWRIGGTVKIPAIKGGIIFKLTLNKRL